MGCIIEKRITRRYEVTDIWDFMKFATFRKARMGMRDTPCTCFWCGHKFRDEEHIYLGVVKKGGNKLFCNVCAERVAKQLGKEKIKKPKFSKHGVIMCQEKKQCWYCIHSSGRSTYWYCNKQRKWVYHDDTCEEWKPVIY